MIFLQVFLQIIFICVCARADCPHERTGLKRWSSSSTWGVKGMPGSGDSVLITDSILMDISPPPLYNVTIQDSGSLTFLPGVDLTLTAANIYINQNGAMEIGSGDCPYRGKLNIVLTGNRESHMNEKEPKVILVGAGGTLEVHGQPTMSWTKITETLNPNTGYDSGNFIFKHEWESAYHEVKSSQLGIVAYTFGFDTKGTPFVKDFGVYDIKLSAWELEDHINRLVDDDVLMMASQISIRQKDPERQSTGVYDAYETLVFGNITGNSILRSVRQDGSTWAFVYQKGNSDSYSEETNSVGTTSTARFFYSTDLIFTAQTQGHLNRFKQQDNFLVSNRNAVFPLVETLDDVTTWQPGDRVVIASTDYDWEQAEEREITFCPDCGNNQFRINKPVEYIHFGQALYGTVDMRAEVGLLTRNVVIRGEMEEECPAYNGNCGDSTVRDLDTFGAHIKVLKDYANVNIEYTELYNVGQQTDAGRYPIHFHMTLDRSPEASVPYLRGNSIHDTFARCTTIHGSHNVSVIDNFCYNHMGHGFFMEDGGEKDNLFDGNLAMSTRAATGNLEPVDKFRPASFWFTNPLNRFKNNVAAGGEGTGIWVVFPDEPLPPSRSYSLMEESEAKRTMLLEFDNNVAHSQNQFGVMIGNHETEDRNVIHSNKWQPLQDPKNSASEPITINLSKITGYKNRNTNIWIEGGFLNVTQVSVADSLNGIFVTNEGQQDKRAGQLSHAVVIGDSENRGMPTLDGFDRSIAMPWNAEVRVRPHSGITMWKGPTQFSDIWFDGFQSNDVYDIGAIAKRRNSPYFFSVTSPFKNLQFAFEDEEGKGTYTVSGELGVDPGWKSEKDGVKISGFTYYGDVATGEKRYYVVKPDHFSAAASDCLVRPNWRMALCETKYGNLRVQGQFEASGAHGIFVRDDLPSAQIELELKTRTGPPVVLDGSRTYTFHTLGKIPSWIRFTADGIEAGETLRIGVCTPPGADVEIQSFIPERQRKERLITRSRFTRVSSLAELDAPDAELDGKKYFLDDTTGMFYYKFLGTGKLQWENGETCDGGRCPDFRVMVKSGNLRDADCRQRLYGANLNMTKPALPTYTAPIAATGGVTPPKGYGAGLTRPFTNRDSRVDGGYGQWSEWSQCSRTCDEGVQYRTRRCDSPLPENGGAECADEHIQSQACTLEPCAIDGRFSEWTAWGPCQVFDTNYCTGFSERYRTCTAPAPLHGGLSCEGNTQQIKRCSVCDML